MSKTDIHLVARGIARAFLAGDWERTALLGRGAEALGDSGRWLRSLVQETLAAFPAPPTEVEPLARLVVEHEPFRDVWARRWIRRGLRRYFPEVPRMQATRWPVKSLETLGDVATWLAVSPEHLDWFADRRGLERQAQQLPLQNFSYTWVPKRSGGARLLEAPKSNLKRIQRRILWDILDHIPPHTAAQGFRRGCSALDHARLHVGKAVVIRFDLQAFFASVHTGRVHGIFRAAGYPVQVSKTLLGLCTNRVPRVVLARAPRPTVAAEVGSLFELRRALAGPHLPQGSPTSPALANLVAYGLDVRLTRLAAAVGGVYSRYADDLTFSGGPDLARSAKRLERYVSEIVRDEGFMLNARKTRVMTAAQRQEVTGIVVNRSANVPRDEFDALKATLHNHSTRGMESTDVNTRAQLAGKVAWVESLSPKRGAKLRALLENIDC